MKLLKYRDVAEVLNVKPQTVRLWRAKGVGPPAIKVGRSIRFDPLALERYLKTQDQENHQND
jgi:excisionase family DNA binding protein